MQAISKSSVIVKQWKNSLKINQDKLLTKIVNDNKKFITDAQKNQLQFGIGSDGKKITPKYVDDDYAEKKASQNQLPGFGTPDLFKSGEMYKNLDFLVGVPNDKEYSFFSDVTYFNDLDDKYKTAFDLSAKSLKPIRNKITPIYNKEYHTLLNK